MKHNNLLLKILLSSLLILIFNDQLILAQEQKANCKPFLANASPRHINNHDKATYTDSIGQIYISNKAFVHGGKLVNTKKFQAPNLITQEGAVGTDDSFIMIDKFLHNNVYYKAKLNLSSSAVQTSYLQTMPFPIVPGVIAGHVQARFVMNPGFEIELYDPDSNQFVESIRDMIVSYEAVLPVGGSYNFALGAVDSSPLVGRIVSGQQKFSEGPDRQFGQYRLPINGLESAQLLSYYLLDAIKIKMDLYYNTIIRNCTTTVFDGIDSLDRFQKAIAQGSLSPFLTTIGGDPVIGPAVNGLLDRFGSEVEHVQDMTDEYNNIFQNFGSPQRIVADDFPFAPGGKDPMTLLVMTMGTENLSEEEKKVVEYVVQDIIHDLPETINMLLASAFSMVEDLQSSPHLIQAITDVITQKLKDRQKELGDNLPKSAVSIQVLFTPYPAESEGTDLTPHGIRAQLPFHIEQIEVTDRNKKEVIDKIQNGIEDVDNNVENQIPAFLKNFSVSIQLQKAASKVTSQFLIGLQPTLQNVDIVNDQVTLKEFEVPKAEDHQGPFWSEINSALNPFAKEKKDPFVNMLLTHEQDLESDITNPLAQIKFGPAVNMLTDGMMSMEEISKSKYMCWSGAAPHTPQLSGTLNDSPLGNDNWISRQFNKFLKGKKVTLSITELEMNLQEMNIKTTKLRIGVLGLRCLNIDSVNKQFGAQANEKIKEIFQKVGPADIAIP